MKDKIIIFAVIIMAISILFFISISDNHFYFEKQYYDKSESIEIDYQKYNELIKKNESFALLIYQPLCITSYNFEKIVTSFTEQYKLTVYKIAFSEIKNTNLNTKIKHYPSFGIFNKGKLISYLDSESDEDFKKYSNLEDFTRWVSKHAVITKDDNFSSKETKSESKNININTVLKNVKYDKEKINIYFFWGEGCPACEKQKRFFDSIDSEYRNNFTIHSFEVWKNKENQKILNEFSTKKGDEVKGVPYTIVGDLSFIGYKNENEILDIIKNKYKNSKDIYFDK